MNEPLHERAQLALDTILHKPTRGVATWLIHIMEHEQIERLAGAAPGEYRRDPHRVYLAMQETAGVCMIDQYIPENPLTIGAHGYEGARRTATTGATHIEVDGMVIDSPEAVVAHMEQRVFPEIRKSIADFDGDAYTRGVLEQHRAVQAELGPRILKAGYAFVSLPGLSYGRYGYENYFMAYALYPEVMEKHFSLQADYALLKNRAAARAFREGGIPPLYRLDHDMADSRGTLVDVKSLDAIWFPHLARCLEPMLKSGVRMIWHCDGNLMQMVPRLLEVGLHGFQGFQYEAGMDYERICRMRTRDGEPLTIIGGVSVSKTLPLGTPDDVKKEMRWLVEYGPKTGLFLGGSSSITPGVPWRNIETLVQGLNYYRTHGRG